MKKDVHCTNCRYFVLSEGVDASNPKCKETVSRDEGEGSRPTHLAMTTEWSSAAKWGKCKRFPIDHIDVLQAMPSPAYLVSGIPDVSQYNDAIVCRALSHLCGLHGDFHTPLDGFGTT